MEIFYFPPLYEYTARPEKTKSRKNNLEKTKLSKTNKKQIKKQNFQKNKRKNKKQNQNKNKYVKKSNLSASTSESSLSTWSICCNIYVSSTCHSIFLS